MYITRTIENQILEFSSFYPVVFLGGPRQAGKTTVLKKISEKDRKFVSLDVPELRMMAKQDPKTFLEKFSPPVLIDEIQYAPELFSYIKVLVDSEQKSGMFWITGSQQFNLIKNISESLAGRVGILNLQGFSQSEKSSATNSVPFLPSKDLIKKTEINLSTNINDIYKAIWKGSYPKLFMAADNFWKGYYSSYIQTYLERDIRNINGVQSELSFLQFMKLLAARTGQTLEYSSIAKEVGVSSPTIKSWVSILCSSGIIYLLSPYYNNISNTIIKSPKIHFMDTGLVCYLTGWNNSDLLERGAMNGAIFESYVVSEIIKSYWNNGVDGKFYYYRDKQKREIDLLIEQDGVLYPVEIKRKSNPDLRDISAFKLVESELKCLKGTGSVVCSASTALSLTDNDFIVPVGLI